MRAVVTFIYFILFLFTYLVTYSYYLSVITLSKTVIILFSMFLVSCAKSQPTISTFSFCVFTLCDVTI